jgi:nicotinamidase-related amidase
MGALSHLADFRGQSAMPILVLVDLHVDFPAPNSNGPDRQILSDALDGCRTVLAHARKCGMPVAFVRHRPPLTSFLASDKCPAWMRGIEPRRSEMIFERALPSCYASSEFAQMTARNPDLVLAGLFGETSCLSTMVEAHHRNHHITYLADASCSRGRDGIAADVMHRSVANLGAAYGHVSSVHGWMEKAALRMGAGR